MGKTMTGMKKALSLLLALITVLACFSFSVVGVAATSGTYYVDGVSGNDTNGGTTSGASLKTIEKAIELANAASVTNVLFVRLTGNYTFAADTVLPELAGGVTLYILGDTEAKTVYLGGRVAFSNYTDFGYLSFAPTCNETALVMQYNGFCIASDVTCVLSGTATEYPSIYAGYYVKNNPQKLNSSTTNPDYDASYTWQSVSCTDGRLHITNEIYGGTWKTYLGGNYREGMHSPIGVCNADIGTTFVSPCAFTSGGKAPADRAADVVAGAGMNIQKGDVTLTIDGATFGCSVYGIPRRGIVKNYTSDYGLATSIPDDCEYSGNVSINISGLCDFSSDNCYEIGAVQNPYEVYCTGSCSLIVDDDAMASCADAALSARGISNATVYTTDDYSSLELIDFDEINDTPTGAEKPVRILCIGDSITEGTGSRAVTDGDSYVWNAKNYNYPARLQDAYDNAGINAIVGEFGYGGSAARTASPYNYASSSIYALSKEFNPDKIVIALGTNNAATFDEREYPINAASYRAAYVDAMRSLIESYRALYADVEIYLTTTLPRWDNPAREEMNLAYTMPFQKQLASEYDYVHLIDLYKPMQDYAYTTGTTYYGDKLHPNNTGYPIMAGFIFDYFENSVSAEFAAGKDEADVSSVLLDGALLNMNRVMVDENKVVLRSSQIPGTDFDGTLQVFVDNGTGVADTNNVYLINKTDNVASIAKSETLTDALTLGGAAIRATAPAGLRTKSVLDTTVFDSALTLNEVGTLARVTSLYNTDKKLDVNCTLAADHVGKSVVYTTSDGAVSEGNGLWFSKDAGKYTFTTVLINIPEANFKTSFTFRSYMKVTTGGKEYTVYGELAQMSIYQIAKQCTGFDAELPFVQNIIEKAEAAVIGDSPDVNAGDLE